MRMHKLMIWICTAAILAGSPVFAKDYEIRLTRPYKVGQSYEIKKTGHLIEQQKMVAQQRILKDEKSSLFATLEGTVTVLKVDEIHQGIEYKLIVAECRKRINENKNEEEVLPKGTQVLVNKDEFLVEGKNVPEDIEKVLGLFFFIPSSKVTDDDVFGTKDRKKVGETWAANSAAAAKDLDADSVIVDKKNIKGNMTLKKVAVVNKIKCLHISGNMEINNIEMSLPQGMTLEKTSMSALFSGDFPIDTSIGRLSEQMNMKLEIVSRGKPSPDAPEITMTVKTEKVTSSKYNYLK